MNSVSFTFRLTKADKQCAVHYFKIRAHQLKSIFTVSTENSLPFFTFRFGHCFRIFRLKWTIFASKNLMIFRFEWHIKNVDAFIMLNSNSFFSVDWRVLAEIDRQNIIRRPVSLLRASHSLISFNQSIIRLNGLRQCKTELITSMTSRSSLLSYFFGAHACIARIVPQKSKRQKFGCWNN